MKVSVFWFRRDLRLEDNTGLNAALASGFPVLPLFIFDKEILSDLPEADARVTFIHDQLLQLNDTLKTKGGSLEVYNGEVEQVWKSILKNHDVQAVYTNRDYEPYALDRDSRVQTVLESAGIAFNTFKDHVIFEKNEVAKADGNPYAVYTPYKRSWLQTLETHVTTPKSIDAGTFVGKTEKFPSLDEIGFVRSKIQIPRYSLDPVSSYAEKRDYPGVSTTHLGPHLRFGTVSIRQILSRLQPADEVFRSQLIWREFFIQILFHFPHVVNRSFHAKYDGILWENNEDLFEKWCEGKTGYPLVDAGMRELNETGYMHNRVRMVTASFLAKDLLIDWRWGEAYFAEKLLDYELASNNGSWQWAAGTGCDAAPYFRIFNPQSQQQKFDPDFSYIKKWVQEWETPDYPEPIVDHAVARQKCLKAYKEGTERTPNL